MTLIRSISNKMRDVVMAIGRFICSRRYSITIKGLDKIPDGMTKTIILPNHPAYIDPIIIVPHLWKKFRPRPMILGKMLSSFLTSWASWLIEPIKVPEMIAQSKTARTEAQAALQQVIDGLQSGRNHIVYPAGRLYRWNQEHLGSVRGLTEILKSVPDAKIILVRTRGLWGSSFSYAFSGEKPSFSKGLIYGAFLLLSNLLFFSPKRKVVIEVEELDRTKLPELERATVNRFFENWYNQYGVEEPTYVPYHFLVGSKSHKFPVIQSQSHIHPRDISKTTQALVLEIIEKKIGRTLTEEERQPTTTLESLGMDSLDRMELSLDVEQRFHVLGGSVPTTVLEVWGLADGLLNVEDERLPDPIWNNRSQSKQTAVPKGNSLTTAIVDSLLLNNDIKTPCVADSIVGTLSNRRFLISSWILAKRIRKMEGKRIGIALPASVGADIVYFATLLANKEPVMINWTTGPQNVVKSIKLAEVKTVISSKVFMDRLHLDFSPAKVKTMETIKRRISLLEKVCAAFTVKWFPSIIRRAVKAKPTDNAAILFTSGSEKEPKAVPLSHKALLSAVTVGCSAFEIDTHDVVMHFLPPFHVFGLVVMLMSLTNNLRMVHHPNPTTGGTISKKIRSYQATILPSTPTFLNFILDRASYGDLSSVRIAVVGAEKCPPAVFSKFKQATQGGALLEGYGMTECCAIGTANTPSHYKEGSLGYPLPTVEIKIVDRETFISVPIGTQGVILVKGDTVFDKYLSSEVNPFVIVDGEKWYNTGDIGSLDKDGFVWFHGRLRRFVKIGGEMVSLPALEEPLSQKYPNSEDGPRVAVEAYGDQPKIVLITSIPELDLYAANKVLMEYGYRGVMRLHEIRYVPKIPMLGSGKTDYQSIKKLLN